MLSGPEPSRSGMPSFTTMFKDTAGIYPRASWNRCCRSADGSRSVMITPYCELRDGGRIQKTGTWNSLSVPQFKVAHYQLLHSLAIPGEGFTWDCVLFDELFARLACRFKSFGVFEPLNQHGRGFVQLLPNNRNFWIE